MLRHSIGAVSSRLLVPTRGVKTVFSTGKHAFSTGPDAGTAPGQCAELVKYELLNLLTDSIDKDEKTEKRLIAYRDIFTLVQSNALAPRRTRADNLYALLYSKFRTTRFLVQRTHPRDHEFRRLEDDQRLKALFKALIERVNSHELTDADSFRLAYEEIVLRGRSDDARRAFQRTLDMMEGLPGTEPELERMRLLFFLGTSQTDIFLKNKLGKDLKKFLAGKEKLLEFLQTYRFINGWITSVGVGAFYIGWGVFGWA